VNDTVDMTELLIADLQKVKGVDLQTAIKWVYDFDHQLIKGNLKSLPTYNPDNPAGWIYTALSNGKIFPPKAVKQKADAVGRVGIYRIFKSVREPGQRWFSDDREVQTYKHKATGTVYELLLRSRMYNVYVPFEKSLEYDQVRNAADGWRIEVHDYKDDVKLEAEQVGEAVYVNGKFEREVMI